MESILLDVFRNMGAVAGRTGGHVPLFEILECRVAFYGPYLEKCLESSADTVY